MITLHKGTRKSLAWKTDSNTGVISVVGSLNVYYLATKFQAIGIRYEYQAENFLNMVLLGCDIILLNYLGDDLCQLFQK